MTTYSLDPETFINEIKKYRELWDKYGEGNRFNKSDKERAWGEVAKIFIPQFDTMTEAEKLDVFTKLYNKWRNIRYTYVRRLKKKDDKREYVYAKYLTFLHSRYLGSQTQNDEEDSSDDEQASKRSKNIEQISSQSDEEPPIVLNIKSESEEFLDTLNVTPEMDFDQEADEDRSFFDSLLPAVKEFDLDQKLDFRCEVIKLIKRIRSERSAVTIERNVDGYVS